LASLAQTLGLVSSLTGQSGEISDFMAFEAIPSQFWTRQTTGSLSKSFKKVVAMPQTSTNNPAKASYWTRGQTGFAHSAQTIKQT
jgi:hypothetical protein